MSRPRGTRQQRDAYDAAAQKIATGAWRVDLATGDIYGREGRMVQTNSYGYRVVKVLVAGHQRLLMAHRVIWEFVHGPITDGHLEINHINGVKYDNRPQNLELVTVRLNSRHAVETGLHNSLHGERSPLARLSEGDAREIRAARLAGAPASELADRFGISRAQVYRIANGSSWRHLSEATDA